MTVPKLDLIEFERFRDEPAPKHLFSYCRFDKNGRQGMWAMTCPKLDLIEFDVFVTSRSPSIYFRIAGFDSHGRQGI